METRVTLDSDQIRPTIPQSPDAGWTTADDKTPDQSPSDSGALAAADHSVVVVPPAAHAPPLDGARESRAAGAAMLPRRWRDAPAAFPLDSDVSLVTADGGMAVVGPREGLPRWQHVVLKIYAALATIYCAYYSASIFAGILDGDPSSDTGSFVFRVLSFVSLLLTASMVSYFAYRKLSSRETVSLNDGGWRIAVRPRERHVTALNLAEFQARRHSGRESGAGWERVLGFKVAVVSLQDAVPQTEVELHSRANPDMATALHRQARDEAANDVVIFSFGRTWPLQRQEAVVGALNRFIAGIGHEVAVENDTRVPAGVPVRYRADATRAGCGTRWTRVRQSGAHGAHGAHGVGANDGLLGGGFLVV